ncbi:MAG: UDP-glucose 4-epimerase [Gammaproteobacteria bacterium]|jgi:UDP-glucose 4-epimerase
MKVVLIGAGGYIGRHLQQGLVHRGHEVLALTSSRPGGIDAKSGLLSANAISVPDIDVVVHLAQSPWSSGKENPAHVLAVNVLSAVQAAQAGVNVGAKRFIYASTGNVYQPSFSPLCEHDTLTTDNWYSLSKVQAEQALKQFQDSIDIHLLRLFGVYGPTQNARLVPNLIQRVAASEAVTLMPGNNDKSGAIGGLRLSLSYINDVVAAFIHVLEHGGPQVMNVATGKAVSIREIVMAVAGALDVSPHFEELSHKRVGDLVADTQLFQSVFAQPTTGFSDGLRATVQSFVEHQNAR